ncbi:KRI1-like family C-terminal-domain-containing protein [Xylogone sp. PMI_703]|nr:KRI1-like family C-terminal-domain-containing protein [Xylogone sp. PMI_703]
MAKRKADGFNDSLPVNGSKKVKHNDLPKVEKTNLLDDSDSGSDSESGGAQLGAEFKINEEYARRFEHNKKREELQRLEEKYSKKTKQRPGDDDDDEDDDDEDSSSDETEDDDGFLATEDLDAEISATLQAIRNKDPRVYDNKTTFYKPIEEDDHENSSEKKKEKPMYLRDYHRENLLKGNLGAEEEQDEAPLTFAQEQETLKKTLVKEMHAAAEDDSESDDDEDGGFLIPKSASESTGQAIHPSRQQNIKIDVDVASADKDPDTFLSNFLAARAWVPAAGSKFQPFESDDEEEEERIEKFEAAYNLRFEDPKGSNEVLRSYARDVVAAKSVRREEKSSRKRQREAAREKKEAEKRERDEERARFRKLKIEEVEEKLKKIKKAAGLRGKALKDDEWSKFLENDWDDETWEKEMNKKFGDDYYAEEEIESGSAEGSDADDSGNADKKKKKKPRKPEWDDDIDIKDLVPDFAEEEEQQNKPAFSLSDLDEEEEEEGDANEDEDEDEQSSKRPKSKKERQQEKSAKKKAARLERKKIEELVDSKMDLNLPLNSKQSTFRYRETSPTSFGLTARDILMAPDTALNQFAGLKKMATFRDPEKKRKDKKKLGKKARLRQWRKETFGNEEGPEVIIGEGASNEMDVDGALDAVKMKKKKRPRKNKGKGTASV